MKVMEVFSIDEKEGTLIVSSAEVAQKKHRNDEAP